jgi:hypothetical protein
MPGARPVLHGEYGFSANSLHLPTTEKLILVLFDALDVCRNHLEFQAGTSGVDDEDIHTVMPPAESVLFPGALFQAPRALSVAARLSLSRSPMAPDTRGNRCGIGNGHEKAT